MWAAQDGEGKEQGGDQVGEEGGSRPGSSISFGCSFFLLQLSQPISDNYLNQSGTKRERGGNGRKQENMSLPAVLKKNCQL